MNEQQNKEYQTVILAGLLHDIGKFLHRGCDEYQGTHQDASEKFLKKFESKLKNDELYNFELLKILVKYHHSTQKVLSLESNYFKTQSEDEKGKIWRFITLIKDADSYSCKERDVEEQWGRDHGREVAPLDSIFSQISLGSKNYKDANSSDEYYRYRINLIDPLSSFPDKFTALDKNEIPDHVGRFEKDLPDFSKLTTFDDVLNMWLNFLEKYTWCIPSDTRYERSDVSLFDHLRSTSAIAACLFKRHIIEISKGEKRLDREYEFILIAGDFSGIQGYIYDITNKGSGGAAKRLRARSFFITAFVETTIHKILNRLDLPLSCNLFSAGGKFLLLAPNIDDPNIVEVKKELAKLRTDVNNEILNTFFNQFTFTLAWIPIKGFKDEFKIYSFFKTADNIFYELEKEKLEKSKNVLITDEKWDIEKFKATKIYNDYQDGDCGICGKGPAIYQDEDTKICFICYRDRFTIGEKLPNVKYIGFGRGILPDKVDDLIRIFHKNKEERFDYYIKLIADDEVKKEEFYLIYDIGAENKEKIDKQPFLRRYIANYVPKKDGIIESFEYIANSSLWDNKEKGSELLGILKADFDNLGLIFSKGFEVLRIEEHDLPDRDRKTMSRYLTLSRMIDLFFSGWMKEIMEGNNKNGLISRLNELKGVDKDLLKEYIKRPEINLSKIYTVYSGGDDLVLVGPWETMIIFALFLNMEFRRFTCYNDDITLSAGLAVVKPKHPIASAIREAEELLERSKEAGKKRIALFDTTVEWKEFPELLNFFLFLNARLNNKDSNIKTGFLHRLLKYHEMAMEFLNPRKKNIRGLKYLSLLSYDIGRNIIERDKRSGNIIKGQDESLILQKLMDIKDEKNSLMYNLKIPVFWALYRNRKQKHEEPKFVNYIK